MSLNESRREQARKRSNELKAPGGGGPSVSTWFGSTGPIQLPPFGPIPPNLTSPFYLSQIESLHLNNEKKKKCPFSKLAIKGRVICFIREKILLDSYGIFFFFFLYKASYKIFFHHHHHLTINFLFCSHSLLFHSIVLSRSLTLS